MQHRRSARLASLVTVVATLAVVADARPARACVGMVQPTDGAIAHDAQVALYVVGETSTEIVVSLTVPAGDGAFGLLVPMPAGVTVAAETIPADDMTAIEERTRPNIQQVVPNDGGGCGCAARGGDLGDNQAGPVISVVELGPVTATVLDGGAGTALADWLGANGFAVAAADQTIIDAYQNAGTHLVALTRASDVALDADTAFGVRMTVPGEHRGFALRMTRLGLADELNLVVLVAAAQGSTPSSPFGALTLDDLDEALLIDGDYPGAVRTAVADAGGKAFVVEGTRAAADVFDGTALAALLAAEMQVTRFSTVMAKDALDEDVAFDGPDIDAPVSRTLDAEARLVGFVPVSALPLLVAMVLAALFAVWRRRRRRPAPPPARFRGAVAPRRRRGPRRRRAVRRAPRSTRRRA